MNTLPLVTIVTPTYNQADFLACTIDSVLTQTYPYIEYIVIDDGSTDNTSRVMSAYNGRLRYLKQSNIGQAAALNRGWSLANGTFLGYLSSDDCLKPNAISELVSALIADSDAVVAYVDFELIDAKKTPFRHIETEDYDHERLAVDLICQPGPGAIFRRRVFEKIGGWNESLSQVPDFDYWLRASHMGRFVRVPKNLAQYRVHEESGAFRPVSLKRSNEIIDVTYRYWSKENNSDILSSRALSRAHLISAKSHGQSGRISVAFIFWIKAILFDPKIVFKLDTGRMLISGILRRHLHKIFRGKK